METAAAVSEADKVAEMSRLWHMRLGHAGEKSLQTLAMQGLLKGVKTCKLDFCEQCVLGKQKRVKFGTTTIILKVYWIIFTQTFGDQPRRLPWEVNITLLHSLMTFPEEFGCIR